MRNYTGIIVDNGSLPRMVELCVVGPASRRHTAMGVQSNGVSITRSDQTDNNIAKAISGGGELSSDPCIFEFRNLNHGRYALKSTEHDDMYVGVIEGRCRLIKCANPRTDHHVHFARSLVTTAIRKMSEAHIGSHADARAPTENCPVR